MDGSEIYPTDDLNWSRRMEERGDLPSWCAAAVEQVAAAEARAVPHFQIAARCYQVWWSLKPGYLPARQDLDPVRFGANLLPHMTIFDVLDNGADYRWRLCGEYALKVIGAQLRHRRISDLETELGEAVLFRDALNWVVSERQPLFYALRHRTIRGGLKRSYGVLLPLRDAATPGDAADRVDHILGAFDWSTGA